MANFKGEIYLDVLENTVNLALEDMVEKEDRYREDILTFQQDSSPLHYAMPVRQFSKKQIERVGALFGL